MWGVDCAISWHTKGSTAIEWFTPRNIMDKDKEKDKDKDKDEDKG